MTASSSTGQTARARPSDLPLRILIALGLLIDAGVHLHLAPGYQAASSGGVGFVRAGHAVQAAKLR